MRATYLALLTPAAVTTAKAVQAVQGRWSIGAPTMRVGTFLGSKEL